MFREIFPLIQRHVPEVEFRAEFIRDLLDFFQLEKAFYEMEYELMNRPAWLHVPLDGTWRILKRHNVVH